MSGGPEGQRAWKQGSRISCQWALQPCLWGTSQQSIPSLKPPSPEQGVPAGAICQGNVPKWPSHTPASPLPGPGRGKGCKFPQVSKLELRKEDKGLTERLGPLRGNSGQGTGLFPRVALT